MLGVERFNVSFGNHLRKRLKECMAQGLPCEKLARELRQWDASQLALSAWLQNQQRLLPEESVDAEKADEFAFLEELRRGPLAMKGQPS
jgi:hypothetical protein